ncbi:MAG: endo-1,4-beta-xylanase [Oscillospiraceae bacterium]|nr:endo-1,4-beta-xylanase [Oscillospiraceae bacterium]
MKKRLLSLSLALTLALALIPPAATGMTVSLALPSLHEIYEEHFLIGSIFSGIRGFTESNLSDGRFDLLKRHFNVLTAENAMKPQYMSPTRGTYSFSAADRMLQAVSGAGIAVHGHALVWHSQSASWLNQAGTTRAQALANMEAFISSVAGHFKGRVVSWDVVNEAFLDSVGQAPANWRNALRANSPWFTAYANGADRANGESGADYIYDAFVFARAADPGATLYYNDFNEEERGKREAIAMMTEELNQKWRSDPRNTEPDRLLIEGLGMQAHYWTDDLNVSNVEATIKRFAATGAKISVTELDIPAGNWRQFKTLDAAEEQKQARLYAQLFQIFREHSEHIERVSIWGLEDPASWRRQGSPLLFDGNFNAKEAFYAVADPDGYLSGRYSNKNTRDALLLEALKPSVPEPEPSPEPEPAAPNLDSADTWAREGIQIAFEKGFIPDDLQDRYTAAVTREEFCRMAVKWLEYALNKKIDAVLSERGLSRDETVFTDTDNADILAAYALDITGGVGSGLFSPDGPITREQAATMIRNVCRAAGADTDDPPDADFADIDDADAWARGAIGFVYANGIMQGTGGNHFNPKGPFTRQESVVTFGNIHVESVVTRENNGAEESAASPLFLLDKALTM